MINTIKDKNHIRKSLLSKRSNLSEEEQKEKSALICNKLLNSEPFSMSKRIAFYHAVRGEADPSGLNTPDTNQQFYLPILSADKNQGLVFAPIHSNTQYKYNEFFIPEPLYKEEELISGNELDLVIMPLVAFDPHGNRLGMGGGYYDRCFSFKKESPETPALVGFAYDFQETELLVAEPWDIPLDMIATESKLMTIT